MQTISSNTASCSLPFAPLGKMVQYEVCIIHQNDTSEKKQQIEYETELHCWERSRDHFLFQLNRKNMKINGMENMDNPAIELAYKCGNVIYPIEFLVDTEGRLTSVNNYPEILQKWETAQPTLQAYFAGAIAEEYIQKTAAAIKEESLFRQLIRSDWFCTLYFAPLYRQYIFDFPLKLEISYPVLPDCQPVFFDVSQFRDRLNSEHTITICQNGTMQQQEVKAIFSTGSFTKIPTTYATMSTIYRINKQTDTIEAIKADFKWKQEEQENHIDIRVQNKMP